MTSVRLPLFRNCLTLQKPRHNVFLIQEPEDSRLCCGCSQVDYPQWGCYSFCRLRFLVLYWDYGNLRAWISNDFTTSDLCYAVVEWLISDLGWERSYTDILIFVFQNADYILPATACILQDRLGLKKECYAEDIALGFCIYHLPLLPVLIGALLSIPLAYFKKAIKKYTIAKLFWYNNIKCFIIIKVW